MPHNQMFPRIKSHSHYPFPVIRLANNAKHGESQKVLENWDRYTQRQAERRLEVSLTDFIERYGYHDIAIH